MLNFNKPRQITEPKLYFITLQALKDTELILWSTSVAAYDLATAQSEAMIQLRSECTDVWQRGMKLGGFSLQSHVELGVARIDSMLTRAHDAREDIERDYEKNRRNELMQTIVDTASRKLLQKYKSEFTTAEVAYLEEEIKKYEQQATS